MRSVVFDFKQPSVMEHAVVYPTKIEGPRVNMWPCFSASVRKSDEGTHRWRRTFLQALVVFYRKLHLPKWTFFKMNIFPVKICYICLDLGKQIDRKVINNHVGRRNYNLWDGNNAKIMLYKWLHSRWGSVLGSAFYLSLWYQHLQMFFFFSLFIKEWQRIEVNKPKN